MNVQQQRNALLAQKLIKNLERRHYSAFYCPTAQDVKYRVGQLIPAGSSIAWGGSATIRDLGVTEMLKNSGIYEVFDRDGINDEAEKLRIYRQAFSCDYYLASVNAMSEDGILVNIDGNGNRVAAITWGPTHVILIVSLNKVCQDVEAAIKRARSTAAPINMQRFDKLESPCHHDGVCHNCLSADSICNYISIQRMSHPAHRHIIILTEENAGY